MHRGRLADRAYHDLERSRARQGLGRVAYTWKVIGVPGPEYEVFLGRLFRLTDLRFGEWPPGFAFQHIHTGEIKEF